MEQHFYKLRVLETRHEIGGAAKSVMFETPPELKGLFTWRAGQHLTLRFILNGEDVRRSYSISSSPFSGGPLRITVKRVKGGLVSNHINDQIEVGDEIDAMPPFGGFCLDPGKKNRRTHYFFGAGSGITPLYSMLKSVMRAEPHSVAHLAYGNKDCRSIIFHDELEQLIEQHADRLTVHHVLSNPSVWTSFAPWRRGIVDKGAVEALITENPPYAQNTQYYICGPNGMNGITKSALTALDVPAERIHMESYGGDIEQDTSIRGLAAKATVQLGGVRHTVPMAEGQTVLGAVRAAGLTPPFSCQSGVCGACLAKLKEGTVHMRARMALEDSDIEDGAVLTCQAVATTSGLVIEYD